MKKKVQSKTQKHILYFLLPFILPLCLVILGIILLVNEDFFRKIFLEMGALIALIGLIEVVIYASRRKYEIQTQYLITGIILLIVGAIFLLIPFTINTLIPVLIGICILVIGLSGISNTFSFRKENTTVAIPLLFAGTNCLLGIFILIYVLFINPNAGWNFIGILMIISGVLRILNEISARIAIPKTTISVKPVQTKATAPDNSNTSPEAAANETANTNDLSEQ